jgi:hypothetical protein
VWEPVLERTRLCFAVTVDAPVVSLNVEGQGTIRLNITGAFLQALLRVLNPVSRQGVAVVTKAAVDKDTGAGAVRHIGRHSVDSVLVHNRLGVRCTVVDPTHAAAAASTSASTTSSSTGSDSASGTGTISLDTNTSGYLALQPHCRAVSLHSAGKLSLTQLPIRVPGTTLYQLHSDVGYVSGGGVVLTEESSEASKSSVVGRRSNKVVD